MSNSSRIQCAVLLVLLAALPGSAQEAPPKAPMPPEAPEPPKVTEPAQVTEPALPPEAPQAPEAPAAATLTEQEREEAAQLLQSTLDVTMARVEGLSDQAWNWKPDEDRWSIAEVVEHLVLVEDVFETLDEALTAPANPQWQEETAGKTLPIYSFMPNRSRKVQAPEFAVPQGGRDRGEMLRALAASREDWVARVQDAGTAFKAHTAPHPAFGTLNVHQWTLFIGLHHLRHNLQIVEVMAEPGFPH